MARSPQVTITILGDATAARKAFADTEAAAGTAEVKVEGFGKAFGKLAGAVGTGLAAFAAIRQVGSEIGSALSQAEDSQRIGAQLTAVLTSTGGAAGVTAEAAQNLATSLQGVTSYEDDTIQSAENLLLTFTNIGANIFPQTTEAVLDMSTALGQDLQTSAIQVGKALQNPVSGVTALQRVGVQFTQQQKDQIAAMVAAGNAAGAQQVILAELNKEFGGSARAEAQTYEGRIKSLGNEYKNLKEALGTAALPALEEFTAALSKGIKSDGFHTFFAQLTHDIQSALSGHLWEEYEVTVAQSLYLIADSFNNALKAISGGHISLDGPLAAFRASIAQQQSAIQRDIDSHVAAPVAAALQGQGGDSPIAPAKVAGYGADIVQHLIDGMSGAQLDDLDALTQKFGGAFKDDQPGLAQLRGLFAAAMTEIARDGKFADATLSRLHETFGEQTSAVVDLIRAYDRLALAQQQSAAAAADLQQAQYNLATIQRKATTDLATYQQGIDAAQAAANADAQAAADAVQGLQDTLAGMQAAAQARADASAQAIAAAQAASTAATETRTRDSQILQAALSGETEAYLAQTDAITDQERALAQRYETEIGDIRRARDEANNRVDDRSVAAHKQDLDYLTRINDARGRGDEKTARALERELAAAQKKRAAGDELARAQQAVADDNYNAAKKQLDQEGKDQDTKDAKAENAAKQNLTNIQQSADAQKRADDAAIKAQEAEIANVQRQAQEQAKRDKKAIDDATTLKTNREAYWKAEETGASAAASLIGTIAAHYKAIADDDKTALDTATKRLPIEQAIAAAMQQQADAAAQIAQLSGNVGATGGARDQRSGTGQASGGPTPALPPGNTGVPGSNAGGRLLIYNVATNPSHPNRYHKEIAWDGTAYWVPDGSTLADYGIAAAGTGDAPGPNASRDGGGSPSFARTSIGGAFGGSFGAAAGAGARSASPAGGDTHIHMYFPNVTEIGDPAQVQALGHEIRRQWADIARGGPPRGV